MEVSENIIDSYIALQPDKVKVILEKIRYTIKNAVPEAEEVISYQMPAFRYHGILIWYAVFSDHYSVFVIPSVLQAFKDELEDYVLTKSAIKIPLTKSVPVQLITKIVKYRAKENLIKSHLKKKNK